MPAMEKIYTPKVALFLNIGEKETPTWKRVEKGVTTLSIKYNPQTTTEQYINENSATTSTDSYQVATDLPLTCFSNEPVFEYIDGIRRSRGVGAVAEVDILIVYLYTDNPYKAERNAGSIAITDFGGDAGKPVVINSSLSFNGDPVIGTVEIADGAPVFTPAL